ncbi:hypothetical protein Tco_0309546 [Tanacetum coccineum]
MIQSLLDIVVPDSAKLVRLGKVCTAIETLKKNTAKALISLLTTITLTTTMVVLDSCPKHNMVAYLEKSEGNAEFHEIIDFLTRSSIHHALTGKHFSGKVTPLFASMLVQPTEDEGAPSERPSEAQPTPSPAPLKDKKKKNLKSEVPIEPQTDSSPAHTSEVSDQAKEIHHLKAHIKKLKKQAKPVIKHHRAWMQIQRDPLFDEIPKDTIDHMETENAQDVGRTRELVGEEKENDENMLSTEDVLSTDKDKFSTDEQIESTDEQRKGTEEQIEGTDKQIESTDEQRKGTEEQIESTDEQRKGNDDHSEEGSELKDIEETDRPKPTSTRSLLTLKPLPKIDLKDKGKKKIEEEDESESESDGIPEAEKKFKQLASDEEMARKIQEEWEGEEERNRLAEEKATNEALIRNFDDIKARIEADRLLAEKLQEQEREQFTIEERAKFLHDTIAA